MHPYQHHYQIAYFLCFLGYLFDILIYNTFIDFWVYKRITLKIRITITEAVCISGGFHDSFPRISSRRSVHQKESFVRSLVRSFSRVSGSGESFSESFVRSFSRVSGSGESFSESFRLTSSLRPSFSFANRECQPSRSDSLPPSVPRSRSRIANASRVVQTHFRPPSLVLVRECQPSRSDSLPPSFTTFKRITKSRFTIVQWCKWLSINTTLTKLI